MVTFFSQEQALSDLAVDQQILPEAQEAHIEGEICDLHVHNREFWRGLLVAPNRRSGDNLVVFQAISGNNAYGVGVLVLDTGDTPIQSGMARFDFRHFLVDTTSQTSVYKLRVAWGTTTEAAAITAGQFTETMYHRDAGAATHRPQEVVTPRLAAHTRVWVACWNATNLATIDFWIGLHEYPVSLG